ncbi:hypothetical protein B0J15DRAFT_408041 [Fusarium solani]|uniref:Uncharacterized protein n=1 Tax=Fusarium solani TaxID=169388 RepID=A0A9P9JRK5_FUSSL|nr:uncharacterized protein B0J15DRAFT_408175 [Fusarium solani]XP_046125048.1 uncharacterized protein B0J15DRAFT_408041 [Fusarium solani]KAH7234373.1 hypothetical protein B0J15DRAFT_408175 [Fusarium solani]KAH7234377.1 hypothetical protein B0J15DRAFT_408041 [Fusarium solani]
MPASWKLGFLALSLLSPLCAAFESPIVNPYLEVPDVSSQTTTSRAACRPRGLDHTTLPIPTTSSVVTGIPEETPGEESTDSATDAAGTSAGASFDSSAASGETSAVPENPDKNTGASSSPTGPPESSDNWHLPPLTPEPTEPAETETAVTGTDGVVVTYTATKDPKETDLTEKKTTTDDDGFVIIIWPGGWKWVPKGGHAPTNRPPAPTKEPKHNDDDNPSSTTPTPTSYDSTTTPTETSTECSATEPPECTITVSYTWMGDDYSSTTLGECPATSGCVTGEQSTTTTYVAETLPLDEEFEPPEEIDDSNHSEDADEETNDWFEDWFDENGFGLGSNVLSPECDGERTRVDYECFLGLFPTFCTEVNENPKDELSRDLTSSDKFGAEEKRGLLSSWLTRREEKCKGYTYTFEWSGEDGDNECDDTCLGAFGQIAAMCAVPRDDGIYAEGQVDVGCGKYNYKVSENSVPTTTQIEEEPTQTTTPLESQAPVCNEVADFKGHADISAEKVKDTALKVCARHPLDGGEYTDDESKKLGIWDEIEKKGGVQFRYSIYWIEGCILEGDNTQSPYQPMGLGNGHPCVTTFMDMWYGCNNNEGVGGYMDVGCIRYRVDAGV